MQECAWQAARQGGNQQGCACEGKGTDLCAGGDRGGAREIVRVCLHLRLHAQCGRSLFPPSPHGHSLKNSVFQKTQAAGKDSVLLVSPFPSEGDAEREAFKPHTNSTSQPGVTGQNSWGRCLAFVSNAQAEIRAGFKDPEPSTSSLGPVSFDSPSTKKG